MAFSGRLRELMMKYGKVALGVHFSISAASIGGLYVAINNNVDVESVLQKIGLTSAVSHKDPAVDSPADISDGHDLPSTMDPDPKQGKTRSRTAELVASSGGALALALLCNKALIPIRLPITLALTPPVARFLRARNLIKNHV